MFVSWRWISQWVDTSGVDPVAFAGRFTCTVAEIDHVIQVGPGLENVRVADVIGVEDHPNADKLHIATVDLGGRTERVVCGAPDLRVGMRVPFVPPGVTLPSGITVREGEVRGVRSPGMLASEADLGLSDDHTGLLSLDGCTAPAGTPLLDAVEVADTLYEVDNKSITHRPDLWGQYGMAREIAAMLDQPLRPLDVDVAVGQGAPVDLQVQASDLCPRYLCARIEDVAIAPAPVDLRLRLRRLGVRPISNVVDATNLVMLETGNPLHAFDARSLHGQAIRVRRATPGETIRTLDGSDRLLTVNDCVIADADRPVALAGIMGGEDSEIRPDTDTVVLEAAAFDAATIRKTAMRLGMRTESSARFEKSLDPALAATAARRFLSLLLQVSPGARITSSLADAGPFGTQPPAPIRIATTSTYLRGRLGVSPVEMADAWIDHCLQALEFHVDRQGDALTVTVPGFRATRDIRLAEDLVEELGRHYGYQRIVSKAPLIPSRPPELPPLRRLERDVRAILVQRAGLTEALLYGFDDEKQRARLGLREPSTDGADLLRLGLRNAISSEMSRLRRNLAPNLISAAERNLLTGDGRQASKKGFQVGMFEIGRVFVPVPDRTLAPHEQAAVDRGVPALLDDPTAAATYLSRMSPEMRQGVTEAAARATPLPWQPIRLGLVLAERLGGGADGAKTAIPPQEVTERLFRAVVGALEAVAEAAGLGGLSITRGDLAQPMDLERLPVAAPDLGATWLHPQRHGLIRSGDRVLGVVSALHPAVRQRLDVPAEVVVAEVDLGALLQGERLVVRGAAPPTHPAVTQDFTLRRPRTDRVADLAAALRQVADAVLPGSVESVQYLYGLDDATGANPERALTFRVICRAADRTIGSDEIARLVDQVGARFGVQAAPGEV
jgi:phenylalanyl-tRNA synthetase beta chain